VKMRGSRIHYMVIPAKAGIQCLLYQRRWVPAFAGTTPVLQKRPLIHVIIY
jgi:hypothetical protein